MHSNEWSLVVFTLFAQMCVGLFIIQEVLRWLTTPKYGIKTADYMSNGSLFLIGPLLLIALAVSFFHLGNPVNAVYVLDNLTSSWLSREILFEILFIGAFALYAFLQLRNVLTISIRRRIALVTGLIGLLLVFSMAKIYMLPTVPVWNNIWTPISFLITTFLLGSLALAVIFTLKPHRYRPLARYAINKIALVSATLIGIEILIIALLSLFPGIHGYAAMKSMTGPGYPNILLKALRFMFLLMGAGLTIMIFYRTGKKNQDAAIKNRLVYAAFLAALFAEALGRYLFYAAYANVGL